MMTPLVVQLRVNSSPGEQAQGAYLRLRREGLSIGAARAAARLVAHDACRNAAEHSRQGLTTERFVGEVVTGYGCYCQPDGACTYPACDG